MNISLPELVIIGLICLCLVGVMAAIIGGVVLLVRSSRKKEQAPAEAAETSQNASLE